VPVGSLVHGLDEHLHEKKRLADIGQSKRNARKKRLRIRCSFKRLSECSLAAEKKTGKDMLTWVNQVPLTDKVLHSIAIQGKSKCRFCETWVFGLTSTFPVPHSVRYELSAGLRRMDRSIADLSAFVLAEIPCRRGGQEGTLMPFLQRL
jgi:hypothetical protein